MVSQARCEVCGRPWDGGTLKAREIACQGCHGEYLAFKAQLDAKGAAIYTDAQALTLARQAHYAREDAAHKALILQRYEWNAAGKSGADGSPLTGFTAQEMTDIKAHAAEVVAKLKGV